MTTKTKKTVLFRVDPEDISWVPHTGQKGPCVEIALAIACGVTRHEARRALEPHGYTGNGASPIASGAALWELLGKKPEAGKAAAYTNPDGSKWTLSQVIDALPFGRWVIHVSGTHGNLGHAVPLVEGQVYNVAPDHFEAPVSVVWRVA